MALLRIQQANNQRFDFGKNTVVETGVVIQYRLPGTDVILMDRGRLIWNRDWETSESSDLPIFEARATPGAAWRLRPPLRFLDTYRTERRRSYIDARSSARGGVLMDVTSQGKDKERDVNTQGGAYIGGGVNTSGGDFVGRDKTTQGDEVGGDKISVGNITGSQGIAIGRNARARVTGSSISSEAVIDAQQLRSALEELWDAISQSQLPHDQKRSATSAASNAIEGVADDEVDGDTVLVNVKRIGETLQQANTVVEQGSSLWQRVQGLAALLGPLVGGARIVAGWFGVAF
jgi:hypothetical protein